MTVRAPERSRARARPATRAEPRRAPWWATTVSFLAVLALMAYALAVTRNGWCLAPLAPVALAALGVRGRLPGRVTVTFGDDPDPP